MCYFLYGAINDGLNPADYTKVMQDSLYHFRTGTAADVNAAVKKCDPEYRITFQHCDCDTPLGSGRTNTAKMKEFEELLLDLQTIRGIKHILVSKNWWEDVNTKTETVHIFDLDLPYFLANMQDNCLYKIELYPRYY